MSLLSRARRLAASVTVEPVLLLFMVGSYMQYTAMQSLLYAKVSSARLLAALRSADRLSDQTLGMRALCRLPLSLRMHVHDL